MLFPEIERPSGRIESVTYCHPLGQYELSDIADGARRHTSSRPRELLWSFEAPITGIGLGSLPLDMSSSHSFVSDMVDVNDKLPHIGS